jgi:hypothetical protein
VTVSGNTTLSLKEGLHSIVVYAEDAVGNTGTSETLFFNVKPFPTSLIIASSVIVTVVLVGLGLLVYGIKRK